MNKLLKYSALSLFLSTSMSSISVASWEFLNVLAEMSERSKCPATVENIIENYVENIYSYELETECTFELGEEFSQKLPSMNATKYRNVRPGVPQHLTKEVKQPLGSKLNSVNEQKENLIKTNMNERRLSISSEVENQRRRSENPRTIEQPVARGDYIQLNEVNKAQRLQIVETRLIPDLHRLYLCERKRNSYFNAMKNPIKAAKQKEAEVLAAKSKSRKQALKGSLERISRDANKKLAAFHKDLEDIHVLEKGIYKEVDVTNYFNLLGITALHNMGLNGQGIKISIMDSDIEYTSASKIANLSKTTRQFKPKLEDNQRAKQELHGMMVLSIISKIAPKSEESYINYRYEHHGPMVGGDDFQKRKLLALKNRVLDCVHKPDFLNISQVLSDSYDRPISPELKDRLIAVAQQGTGIIVALGNEGFSNKDSLYLKSLFEVADSEVMRGRMLLVTGSGIENDTDSFPMDEGKFKFNFPSDSKAGKNVITAPGLNIPVIGPEVRETSATGTSFSAPIVTGIAGLIKQKLMKDRRTKDVPPEDVFAKLLETARHKTLRGDNLDYKFGRGIIDPKSALEQS